VGYQDPRIAWAELSSDNLIDVNVFILRQDCLVVLSLLQICDLNENLISAQDVTTNKAYMHGLRQFSS
jgi:hypothetical protein